MKKDAFYFSHDYNAQDDAKILNLRSEYGWEGYGLYWAIIERMAIGDGKLNSMAIGGLSVGLSHPKDRLLVFLEFCVEIGLFIKDSTIDEKMMSFDEYYSPRLLQHLKKRAILKESGKKGAKLRWTKSHQNSHPNSPPNAKERKGKERKDNIIDAKRQFAQSVIDTFNNITGKSIELDAAGNRMKNIWARHQQGATLEDFEKVIRCKHGEWKDTDQRKYIRPETLFVAKHWQDYLEQAGESDQRKVIDINKPWMRLFPDVYENQGEEAAIKRYHWKIQQDVNGEMYRGNYSYARFKQQAELLASLGHPLDLPSAEEEKRVLEKKRREMEESQVNSQRWAAMHDN